MHTQQNVFLVGPMGAGKSTIGRQLATTLNFEFEDSDYIIQKRTGVDIPTIFEYEGEAGFRHREAQILNEITKHQGIVLATGGGSVLPLENRSILTTRGFVVYLYCSPEQQHERTAKDRNRPLIRTEDPLKVLQELMQERDPLYREVADLVVSTERRTTVSVVHEILSYFKQGENILT